MNRSQGTTPSFKLAFIGSHGVGKTTLTYGLASRLKARDVSLEVVHEVARRCPLPINRETSVAAQSWILHTQISEEVLAAARYPVVLCDRSALDNYVYLLLAAGPRPELEGMIEPWLASYDLLVHVPIGAGAGEPRPDGLRSTDPSFQRAVEQRLDDELVRRRLSVVRLDPDDRSGWLDTVSEIAWDRVQPAQLELLSNTLPSP